jgi:dihydroorotate dehydrogenase
MTFSSFEYRSEKPQSDRNVPSFVGALEVGDRLQVTFDRTRRALESLAQSLLIRLEPETAHELTLKLIRLSEGLYPTCAADDERLAQGLLGLKFKNPIGVAAGFDKDAEVFSYLLRKHGFGFVEIGTVTPRSQKGNERPRVFRMRDTFAVINRFGFNNDGLEKVLERLKRQSTDGSIVGVNLGANKDSVDRVADYVFGIHAFAQVASYYIINISSPNTPGLRDLHQRGPLQDLLSRVLDARERVSKTVHRCPILLKISPDLTLTDLDDVVEVARHHSIDGMIVGNTTSKRPRELPAGATAPGLGGLSGRPLFSLSTRMLAEAYVRVEGSFPLIGVGGIDSDMAGVAKVRAGASLVQFYSGLVFRGLRLVEEIKRSLIFEIEREKAQNLSGLVGLDAISITKQPWPDQLV